MNVVRGGVLLCCCLVVPLLGSMQVSGAESNPWWNPLGIGQSDSKQSKPAGHASESKSKSSLISLPKMPFSGTNSHSASKAKTPSTWEKVNSGTKSFFGKTKDVLMPWSKDDSASHRSKAVTGSRRSGTSAKSSSKSSSSGGLSSWFQSKPEEKDKIESVNDFLKLPTPY